MKDLIHSTNKPTASDLSQLRMFSLNMDVYFFFSLVSFVLILLGAHEEEEKTT